MLGLGVLAAFSLLASELPLAFAVPLAVLSLGQGARLARRELGRPEHGLSIPAGEAIATIDDEAMTDLRLAWRGPLAFLCWRDREDRRRRLQLWSDQLDARGRRELRLAMATRSPAPSPRSMAP